MNRIMVINTSILLAIFILIAVVVINTTQYKHWSNCRDYASFIEKIAEWRDDGVSLEEALKRNKGYIYGGMATNIYEGKMSPSEYHEIHFEICMEGQ